MEPYHQQGPEEGPPPNANNPFRQGGGNPNNPFKAQSQSDQPQYEAPKNPDGHPLQQQMQPQQMATPAKNWDKPDSGGDAPSGFRELFKANWHPTLVYCGVFWSFGMCVAFLGPTLLDLGCQTSTTMETISWVFFAQLLFTLIGSLIGGYLAQKGYISPDTVDANYVIAIAAVLIPAAMFVIPLCKALVGLAIVLSVMGINMGLIDTLANLQMIQLYQEAVPPFLQAMHFCYGLGAFVSPMIAEPFLLNEDCSPLIKEEANNPLNISIRSLLEPDVLDVNTTSELYPAETLEEAQQMTEVKYAFWIMSAMQLPIPVLVMTLIVRIRCNGYSAAPRPRGGGTAGEKVDEEGTKVDPAQQGTYGSVQKEKDAEKKPFWKEESKYTYHRESRLCGSAAAQIVAITGLTAAMMFIYEGLQSSYGGYVYSYAVKSILDLNKTEGAYLNACFWGTFALGRLLSILIATRFSPAFMLLCNISGSLVAMVIILAWRHDHVALYVGTCLFGIFLSSVAPTSLSLCEQYIDVTSSITTFIIIMAALGEMTCPVIVGNMFVPLGPVSFLIFCSILVILSVVVYIAIWGIGQKTPKAKASGNGSFVWCKQMCGANSASSGPDGATGDTSDVRHVKYYTRMSESDSIELNNVAGSGY